MPTPSAPAGWPRAATPLTIALLGWARLEHQAREGSGYNLNASELAAGLVMSGHRVVSLSSGLRYSVVPGMRIVRTRAWRGVEAFELVNSPNCSPAAVNFRNMARESSAPAHSRLVASWARREGAQVVHIHSLEGYGLDLIGVLRDAGLAVVVTPHNYWYLCPQVDLLHKETAACLDYQGGARCVGCLKSRSPRVQRLARAVNAALALTIGGPVTDALRHTARRALAPFAMRKEAPVHAPGADPEAAKGFDALAAEGTPAASGLIEHALPPEVGDPAPEAPTLTLDQNERFLRGPRELHLRVVNEYGARRISGVRALGRASLVTPPSDFLRRVHVMMGLEEHRTRVVRLGQPHFDQIHRRARRAPTYDQRPWSPASPGPVRLAFLGTTRANKGLDVLARAIPMLDARVRQRCQILVRAAGWDWPVRRRLAAYPEVQFAGGYDVLQLIAATGEYDVGILPHIWFENSPLVLLEHLHAGKFVLAARLGGPAEWIVEPTGATVGNGLFFPAGDAGALAERITRIVTGRVALPSPREVHAATPFLRSYPEHIAEVESIYREVMARDQ